MSHTFTHHHAFLQIVAGVRPSALAIAHKAQSRQWNRGDPRHADLAAQGERLLAVPAGLLPIAANIRDQAALRCCGCRPYRVTYPLGHGELSLAAQRAVVEFSIA